MVPLTKGVHAGATASLDSIKGRKDLDDKDKILPKGLPKDVKKTVEDSVGSDSNKAHLLHHSGASVPKKGVDPDDDDDDDDAATDLPDMPEKPGGAPVVPRKGVEDVTSPGPEGALKHDGASVVPKKGVEEDDTEGMPKKHDGATVVPKKGVEGEDISQSDGVGVVPQKVEDDDDEADKADKTLKGEEDVRGKEDDEDKDGNHDDDVRVVPKKGVESDEYVRLHDPDSEEQLASKDSVRKNKKYQAAKSFKKDAAGPKRMNKKQKKPFPKDLYLTNPPSQEAANVAPRQPAAASAAMPALPATPTVTKAPSTPRGPVQNSAQLPQSRPVSPTSSSDPTPETSLVVGLVFGAILLVVLGLVAYQRLGAAKRRREYRRMNDFLIDGMYNDL